MKLPEYLRKMQGTTRGSPPRVSSPEIFWSWTGAFLGIAAVAWVNHYFFTGTDLSLMIGSFGATAVLVYGAVRSPLAQPRNLIGGHILSAIVGVACWKLLHPDTASARWRHGADRGDRIAGHTQAGVLVCADAGHRRAVDPAGGRVAGQQHSGVAALSRNMVLTRMQFRGQSRAMPGRCGVRT
jgi:hypothetical protein